LKAENLKYYNIRIGCEDLSIHFAASRLDLRSIPLQS